MQFCFVKISWQLPHSGIFPAARCVVVALLMHLLAPSHRYAVGAITGFQRCIFFCLPHLISTGSEKNIPYRKKHPFGFRPIT
jgi:hypothetical protein